MAFAWAFIGVALSLYFLSKKYKINFLSLTDLVVSILPLWLGLGRIWNYINWELFWKGCPNYLIWTFMCQKFWTTNFHFANQLLESLLEGWLLLLIFQYLVWKKNWLKKEGYLTVFFVIYYSVVRFFLEFIRWHPQDYIVLWFLSRSQVFMIVFFVAGLILLLYLNKRENV
jgi:phosphatidylglycerol:prolipoprotein diacylglycerol transferase